MKKINKMTKTAFMAILAITMGTSLFGQTETDNLMLIEKSPIFLEGNSSTILVGDTAEYTIKLLNVTEGEKPKDAFYPEDIEAVFLGNMSPGIKVVIYDAAGNPVHETKFKNSQKMITVDDRAYYLNIDIEEKDKEVVAEEATGFWPWETKKPEVKGNLKYYIIKLSAQQI